MTESLSAVLAAIDAAALRAAPAERVVAWLEESLRALVSESDTEGSALAREALGSPLSAPVLNDAIAVAAGAAAELEEAVRALDDRQAVGRVAMILPANVETAAVRPLVWALLARDAVAIRVSSRRAGVAPRLVSLLEEHDRELARAVGLVRSPRHDAEGLRALSGWADVLHAWGQDESLDAIAGLAARGVVRHGRGLGLALVRGADVDAIDAEGWDALAIDVARHDQRGCLSPHALLVLDATDDELAAAGHALDRALGGLAAWFPRGILDERERAAARAWKDTAIAIGASLLEGSGHALSMERGPVRTCPTGRHLAVHAISESDALELARALGPHLKTVGVPATETLGSAPAWLAELGAHRVSWGEMQAPGLLAPADGAPPWMGFAREAGDVARSERVP